MEVDLNSLGLRIGGRKKAPLVFEYLRDLDADDVVALQEERQSSAPAIKVLRAKHHALAKLLASGVSEGDAAIMIGYSSSRISVLKSDPSFRELMTFYQAKDQERHFDMAEAIADFGGDVLNVIADRLETDPDSFTISQLNELMKTSLDRSGFGPSAKQEVNVKVGLADRFEAARKRVESHKRPANVVDIIDAEAVEITE